MKSLVPVVTSTPPDEDQVSRVRRAITHFGRRLRQEAGGDVTPSQVAVMVSLDRLGPLTLGDLAAEEHISAPAASRTVSTLEEEGHVARQVDAGDRRVTTLSLTAKGRRTLEDIRRRRNLWLKDRMSGLSARQLSDLQKGIDVIEQIIGDRASGNGEARR
jgi:DNA-binding MarR family transcriptional regulator